MVARKCPQAGIRGCLVAKAVFEVVVGDIDASVPKVDAAGFRLLEGWAWIVFSPTQS